MSTDTHRYNQLRSLCLQRVVEICGKFKSLDQISREDLKSTCIYYREWGFAACPPAKHIEVAKWIIIYEEAHYYVDNLAQSGYSTIDEYADCINNDGMLDSLSESSCPFCWVSGAMLWTRTPVFCTDKGVFTQYELDKLGQFMGIVKYSKWING